MIVGGMCQDDDEMEDMQFESGFNILGLSNIEVKLALSLSLSYL